MKKSIKKSIVLLLALFLIVGIFKTAVLAETISNEYDRAYDQNDDWEAEGGQNNGFVSGTEGSVYQLAGVSIDIIAKGMGLLSGRGDQDKPYDENLAASYSSVIQAYQMAESSDFNSDIMKNLPYINQEIMREKRGKMYYTIQDISGDSIPELIISDNSYGIEKPSAYNILDAYRLVGGNPERIFDAENVEECSRFTICENQMMILIKNVSGVTGRYDFYQLDGNTTMTIQSIFYEYDKLNNPKYYLTNQNNDNLLITENEANSIINSFSPRVDIHWLKV